MGEKPEHTSGYKSAWATGMMYIVVKTGYLGQRGNYIITMGVSTRRAEDLFR